MMPRSAPTKKPPVPKKLKIEKISISVPKLVCSLGLLLSSRAATSTTTPEARLNAAMAINMSLAKISGLGTISLQWGVIPPDILGMKGASHLTNQLYVQKAVKEPATIIKMLAIKESR